MLRRLGISFILILSLAGGVMAQSSDQNNTEQVRIWIADSVPTQLLQAVTPLFESDNYAWVTDLDGADLALDFETNPGAVTAEWVYVPVVAFANTAETVRWEDMRRYWQDGDLSALASLSADNTTPPSFIASNETYRAMLSRLGAPHESVPFIFVPTTDAIADKLWEQRNASWAILGFQELKPQVKTLRLDRHDVFGDDFDNAAYPLTTHIDLKGDTVKLGRALEDLLLLDTWRGTNRDSAQIGRVVLTGVTALSRATAYKMEQLGLTKPAEGMIHFVQDAHIVHTSNEVAFTENCAYPDPFSGSTIFCSRPKYIELLTHIGVNVVELTGNHVNDYGPGAFRTTLDLYGEIGMGRFGGGYDPDDARAAYFTEVNGTTLAFIGCNVPGPNGAFASPTRAGAAQCDDEYLREELARLAGMVDLVIMGVQEFEYYRYSVGIEQVRRFQNYADWGADIVIGSQAHQPQGFEFYNGAFFHHGLGNLFFDQMQSIGTRQMFIDKLIIYEGRLLNVVLYTGLIEDYCCPRPMTSTERADFLNTIFLASGW